MTNHDSNLILATRKSENIILVTFIIVDAESNTLSQLKSTLSEKGSNSFSTKLTEKLKEKAVTSIAVTGAADPSETTIPGKSDINDKLF